MRATSREHMVLAGDIGGTKTDLAIFVEDGALRPYLEAEFRSADYPSLQVMISEFLARAAISVECACFGVAGPVVDRSAKITNLPWIIDGDELQRGLNFKFVHL